MVQPKTVIFPDHHHHKEGKLCLWRFWEKVESGNESVFTRVWYQKPCGRREGHPGQMSWACLFARWSPLLWWWNFKMRGRVWSSFSGAAESVRRTFSSAYCHPQAHIAGAPLGEQTEGLSTPRQRVWLRAYRHLRERKTLACSYKAVHQILIHKMNLWICTLKQFLFRLCKSY